VKKTGPTISEKGARIVARAIAAKACPHEVYIRRFTAYPAGGSCFKSTHSQRKRNRGKFRRQRERQRTLRRNTLRSYGEVQKRSGIVVATEVPRA
jgi:hypothetical protein